MIALQSPVGKDPKHVLDIGDGWKLLEDELAGGGDRRRYYLT